MKKRFFTFLICSLGIFIGGCVSIEKKSIEGATSQYFPAEYDVNGYKEFSSLTKKKAEEKAIKMAQDDFKNGVYKILIAGNVSEELPSEKYLREKYHVYTVPLAGCIVDSGILAAKDGYNNTIIPLLKKKFGKDIVAEAVKYEEGIDRHAPLLEDFGLVRVIVFTSLLIPNDIKKFTIVSKPNEIINVIKKANGDWMAISDSSEMQLKTYHINDSNVQIKGKTRTIALNLSSLFQYKNNTQIKKMTAMNIWDKRNKEVKVKIDKHGNSIIFSSGEKKPIKVSW